MNEPINLTREEIKQITNAVRPTTQATRLRQMGFTVISRPNLFPLVSRKNFLLVTGAIPREQSIQSSEPNWGAI